MRPLHRVLYQSECLLTGSAADVRDQVAVIIGAALHRNGRDGLTGALMFAGGLFVQALEGEADKLEATFERICRDTRHRRIVLHEFSETPGRAFAEWGMVAVPGASGVDELLAPATEGVPTAGRNTALAGLIVGLMRDRLSGVTPPA